MRVSESNERAGYFWLPSNPNRKIPGTLSIKDGGKIELEVLGTFAEGIEAFRDNEDFSRIVGQVEQEGLVTLDSCFYTKKNISFGGLARSKIYVAKVIAGVAYDHEEQVILNSFTFAVEGLDEWVGFTGINVTYADGYRSAQISYKPQDAVEYRISDDLTLSVNFGYTLPGAPAITEAKITQTAYITISSEKGMSLESCIEHTHKITSLLCFAIDETVSVKNVSGTCKEIQTEIGDGKKRPVRMKIYYSSISFAEQPPKIHWHMMLFRFPEVKETFDEIISKWLEAYEVIAPALGLYFSTKNNAHRYLDSQFLSLAQGIETYNRRTCTETQMPEAEFEHFREQIIESCEEEKRDWLRGRLLFANELSLSQRLKKTMAPFKKHIGNSDTRDKLIRKIVDTRNYLTHYDESLRESAAQGQELWVVCMKLEAIFQLNFLSVLGFTDDQIELVVKNCHNLNRKLNEI